MSTEKTQVVVSHITRMRIFYLFEKFKEPIRSVKESLVYAVAETTFLIH